MLILNSAVQIKMSFFEFFHFCWGIFFKKFEFLFSDIWQKKWKSNQKNKTKCCHSLWFSLIFHAIAIHSLCSCLMAHGNKLLQFHRYQIFFSFFWKGKTKTNTPNSRNFQGEQSCFTSILVIYSDIFRQFYMFHLLGGWCRFWILFLIHFRITSFFLLEISLVLFKTTIETEKIIPIIFLFEKNWKIKLVLSFVDNTYVHREPVECKINFYILKNKKLVLFSRILIILLVKCWAK